MSTGDYYTVTMSADRVAGNLVVFWREKTWPWFTQGRSHFLHSPKFFGEEGSFNLRLPRTVLHLEPCVEGRELNRRSPAPGPQRLQYLYAGNTSNGSFIWDLFVRDNIACKNQLQLKSSRFQAKRSGMRFYFSCLSLSNFVTEEVL